MAFAFVGGLESGNYLSLKGIDYIIPITALIFGIVYFFIIIRIREKLINLLLLGSFVLLLGVLLNTILSLGVFNGWWTDLPFPHFVITEVAVLFEVVVFALALGYRSQQAEAERLRIEQLDRMKSRFSKSSVTFCPTLLSLLLVAERSSCMPGRKQKATIKFYS